MIGPKGLIGEPAPPPPPPKLRGFFSLVQNGTLLLEQPSDNNPELTTIALK